MITISHRFAWWLGDLCLCGVIRLWTVHTAMPMSTMFQYRCEPGNIDEDTHSPLFFVGLLWL